ncbi:helix-turn-helix domain-containing protein [Dictyoglomus thermophilum]|uniref:Transcriptional regulator, putative n=2 Tax=Dictyoglomus thermophilum TaxID=14 RepID=B5YF66_DICT6|nr:helix-turn-helix domain-containing protein [Dictyoglomus thermophilum]ACI19529.1 transcriptional regulator, putative [Dictyoglomus thermophilum H-6-12]MCX7719909.1 DUF4115 domain-containing protein [Dictyoglomus thermophilum]TYT22642.1 helix-turn-helix domain-containing protein [Dictyoglomus thermophilum]
MVRESKSLGEILREEREKKGLSLREVANLLKISYRYLKHLEDDEYDKVNLAEVYKRGILRKYSNFLGLNEEEIIKTYNTQYQLEKEESSPELVKPKKSSLKYIAYFLVISIIFLTVFLTVKLNNKEVMSNNFKNRDITSYEINIPESYTKTIESSKVDEIGNEVSVTNTNTFTNTIKVVALDRVWLRVNYEDKTIYEGILKRGDTITWTYTSLYFHIGNAGGLEIYYNDKNIGTLGKKGEVVKLRVP